MNKVKKLAILAAATFILNGCATAYISSQPVTSSKRTNTLFMEDEVIAVAAAKESTVQSTKGDMVLIGKSNTYHITKGNQEIKTLMELDPDGLKINRDEPIQLTIHEGKFSGVLNVTYTKSAYSDVDIGRLVKQGFNRVKLTNSGEYYSTSFRIDGTVYAKVDDVPQTAFSKGRKVQFYTEKWERTVNASQVLNKATDLPFAIIFDVITLPVQALILAGAVVSSSTKK
jgi:uncharacterized protein YceK